MHSRAQSVKYWRSSRGFDMKTSRMSQLANEPNPVCCRLSSPFHHYEVITETTLHLRELRICHCAGLQLIRRLLIAGIERPACLPPQAASLTCLVLREFTGDIVKFGSGIELGERFFLLGVFLALGWIRNGIFQREGQAKSGPSRV